MLKPHDEYYFVNEDKVFIDDIDGGIHYFMLFYDKEVASWMLLEFEDKYFKDTKKINGTARAEFLYEYGYDILERVEEYDFNELP